MLLKKNSIFRAKILAGRQHICTGFLCFTTLYSRCLQIKSGEENCIPHFTRDALMGEFEILIFVVNGMIAWQCTQRCTQQYESPPSPQE